MNDAPSHSPLEYFFEPKLSLEFQQQRAAHYEKGRKGGVQVTRSSCQCHVRRCMGCTATPSSTYCMAVLLVTDKIAEIKAERKRLIEVSLKRSQLYNSAASPSAGTVFTLAIAYIGVV